MCERSDQRAGRNRPLLEAGAVHDAIGVDRRGLDFVVHPRHKTVEAAVPEIVLGQKDIHKIPQLRKVIAAQGRKGR